MSKGENSEGSVSNEDLNESEMSDNGSESGDVGPRRSSDKLDSSDRELYEKLKRQEREEREEIEKELKRAHEEAIIRRHEELRAKELRLHAERLSQLESERGQDLRVNKPHEDFRSLRDGHPLTKSDSSSRLDLLNHSAFLDRNYHRAESLSPHSATSTSPTGDGPAHHWTFEEQFKQAFSQLYELSDDPKRKEFLDDLFQFMQKRGTPVNRIPIMAKQTLDLYELFRLVVSKGGLVEVINKKLWREITKGLNLPSSITSAAFTLRTQYMKYLYPYECEKLKLSTPQELQAAIDGNRREGRRSSYGYDLSPGPTLIPSSHHPHLNGGIFNGKLGNPAGGVFRNEQMIPSSLLKYSSMTENGWNQKDLLDRRSPLTSLQKLWQLQHHQLLTGGNGTADEDSLPPTPTHPRSITDHLTERDAIAMEAASRAMEHATRKMEEASRAAAQLSEEPPRKRPHISPEEERVPSHAMPNTHIKITSRNDGRSDIDNSLVVSMEINGIMYQGVLFAHNPRRM